MKKLLLLFAMCSSLGAWAQTPSISKSVSPDGKTLTLEMSGDFTGYVGTFEENGYKFTASAVNKVFFDNEGNSVAEGGIYSESMTYYGRTQLYKVQPVPKEAIYTLSNPAYTLSGSNYVLSNVGSTIEDSKTYFENQNTEQKIDDMDSYQEVSVLFSENVEGWIYKTTKASWDASLTLLDGPVSIGTELKDDVVYAKLKVQGQDWNGFVIITDQELKDGDYTINATVIKKDANIYTIDGTSYNLASGSIYDSSKEYYSNVSFAPISDIKESTYANSKIIIVPEAGVDYFIRTGTDPDYSYTQVYSGADYDSEATYCVKDGFNYMELPSSDVLPYIYSAKVADNYWESIVAEANANRYETLIFKGVDGEELPLVTSDLTHEIMKCTTVTTLDMGKVVIDKLESPYTSGYGYNSNGTFIFNNISANLPYQSDDNKVLTHIVLPYIKDVTKTLNGEDHYHVPSKLLDHYKSLVDVIVPGNATCLEKWAFSTGSQGFHLTSVTLNDGLQRIGEEAFAEDHLVTLVIPETVKFIGKNAFKLNYLHDVYFLGKTAPVVGIDAFGSEAYVNNNDHEKPDASTNYTATRANYVNGAYMAAMLHLNPEMTLAERARFTDVTRDYHVFDLYETNTAETPTVKASAFKSSTTLAYRADKGMGEKDFVCWNGVDEALTLSAAVESGFKPDGCYNRLDAGGKGDTNSWLQNSAYYDTNVGEQYCWPTQANYVRAYVVATNGILYDGKTKISEGIENAGGTYIAASYDGDCDGTAEDWADGKEYIGLHQFILVTMDVNKNTKIDEWAFDFEGANWWTLCVPVDMTVAEVRKAFGEDTQVCKFSNVTRKADDKVKFFFTDEQCLGKDENLNAVEANFPYMIRPSKAKDATYKFTLPNYTLSPAQIPTPVPITVTDGKNGKSYTYTYIGQYNTNQNPTSDADKYLYMPQYSYYLGAEPSNPTYHKLYIQTGTTGKWKPYTCVILPSDGADDYATFFDPDRNASQEAKSVAGTLGLDDFEGFESATTGISNYEVICGSDAAPVYNLNGQKVDSDNLRKGIYIKNGVKFIVK